MTAFLDRPISPQQVKLVQIARRAAGIAEADYRTLLRSIGGGVESTKDLTQGPFERLMAYLESAGFVDAVHGQGHWTAKWERSGTVASERQCRLIRNLAAESRYDLAAMCERFSAGHAQRPAGHAQRPDGLTPRQAHSLIEMLKAEAGRSPHRESGAGAQAQKHRQPQARSRHADPVEPMREEEVPF